MYTKDRYNNMIKMIENLVQQNDLEKTPDIAKKVADSSNFRYRDINTIFTYLTGESLQDYIRERRMMTAYAYLIKHRSLDIEGAIILSGYDNNSSFDTAFKNYFDMSPSEAFAAKNHALITSPKDWDSLSNSGYPDAPKRSTKRIGPEEKFGITKSQYEKILEAADLQELYEFNDATSEVAYEVAEKHKVSMKKAFEFVDDYMIYTGMERTEEPTYETIKTAIISAGPLMEICFAHNLSIAEAYQLIDEVSSCGYALSDLSEEFVKGYLRNNYFSFCEYLQVVEDFKRVGGKNFEDFLENIHWGYSPEAAAALADITADEIIEIVNKDEQCPKFDHEYEEFDKWAEEETDYYRDF